MVDSVLLELGVLEDAVQDLAEAVNAGDVKGAEVAGVGDVV